MLKTDAQLKSNDCGISAVKTIYNIFQKNISRKYIEKNIPLDDRGSRLYDIKVFLDANGCDAQFKILDINYIVGNTLLLDSLFPFILPIESKVGLHYVVVNERRGNKLKIYDPEKGNEYYLSLQELKKKSHFGTTDWDYIETNEKIEVLCKEELKLYDIDYNEVNGVNDNAVLFNKLTYFTYLKENFGFKDNKAEKEFISDLLLNQEINVLPKHFKTLKYNSDIVKIKAPIILTVKQKIEAAVAVPKEEKTNIYWDLFKQLGQYRKIWYIYIFAAFFSASTAQFAVFVSQILIDNVLPSYNLHILYVFIIGLGIYKILDLSTSIYRSFVSMHLGNILDKFFLQTFDSKINAYSLPYLSSYKKGDLLERVSDSLKLKTFFLRFFTGILVEICVAVYSLAILLYINWKIALIVLVVMLLFWAWFNFITPYIKQNERTKYIRKADYLSKIIEKIDGIQVIKSFKIETYHSNKINTSIDNYLKIQLKNGYIDILNRIVVSLIIIFSSLLILYSLSKLAILDQAISLGTIITFIALSSKIFSSLSVILEENLSLQENEVVLKRNLDFFEPERAQTTNGISKFDIEKITLKDINFGYFQDVNLLENINLEINKGDKIKIEGQNGSGKSTLSKILTGLYAPNSGSFLINDTLNKLYNTDAIRDKILLVSNEDILFNDSILDNICLGRKIDLNLIIDYAKKIDLYDFVAQKEEAFDFIVSENGKNLSTGQRKKILFMRAILSSNEVIILDEVLSGMDVETRNKIEKLIEIDKNKAFVIISHEPISFINFTKKYKIIDGKLNSI